MTTIALIKTKSKNGKNLLERGAGKVAVDLIITERWEKIKSFQIDDSTAEEPFSFVLREEMQWEEGFAILAIQEYKKFMLLSSLYPSLMTPSVHVDTVWHLHLLYTRSYQRFCAEALDCKFLHHEPSKGGEDEEGYFKGLYQDTLAKYDELFGEPPPTEIWGKRV